MVERATTEGEVPPPTLADFEVPGYRNLYVIGHGATQVTVYAQQVRALNLVHTLGLKAGEEVVVIGGGIAGVTAAAAARLHGAKVALLEQGEELLHLQRGCHTRHLHPRLYDWPTLDARRALAELPILSWSVGTASDVAARILSDYFRISNFVAQSTDPAHAPPFVGEHCGVTDICLGKGGLVSWRKDDQFHEVTRPRAVILALGFGIERTVPGLSRRSYWRVDSLTQTALDSEASPYVVAVSGTGDGGILDVLRAKLKEFDHAGFIDECVLRLEDPGVRPAVEEIQRIEAIAQAQLTPNNESDLSVWLHHRYLPLEGELGAALEDLLRIQRRRTDVIWLGRIKCPVTPNSQLLYRLLGWLLWRKGLVRYRPVDRLDRVEHLEPADPAGCRYRVVTSPAGPPLDAHQVVVRHGAEPTLARSFKDVHEALRSKPRVGPVKGLHRDVWEAFREPLTRLRAHSGCPPLLILARPELGPREHRGQQFYRIRIWLQDEPRLSHVSWVDYDLHPEYGTIQRRAVRRAADDEQFRHWVNTWDDFWIRVRCNDGTERGTWLTNAIEKWASKVADADQQAAERCVAQLRTITGKLRKNEHYYQTDWCEYVQTPFDAQYLRS
jgi:hypothetical protein